MKTYYFSLTTLTFIFSCYVCQTCSTPVCEKQEKFSIYLDVAVDMITKAKEDHVACSKDCSLPIDCAEVRMKGHSKSGIFTVWPKNRLLEDKSLEVYCDMETDGGGWTVIQRRGNFGSPKDYFFKDWENYKRGFGDLEKDFWLGNDNIFALSNQRLYSARFDLTHVTGESRYAKYSKFWIDDEASNYTLHIEGYSGDAGDSMTSAHNNRQFSTKDRKNDHNSLHDCAKDFKGAWWYGPCHLSNLNGLYHRGLHKTYADGVNWYHFKGFHESLETTEIKIRPLNFTMIPTDIQNLYINLDFHELSKENETLNEVD